MIFVDTSFVVALLDLKDRHHLRATALLQAIDQRRQGLITTDAVLIEIGNYFARSWLRADASDWIQAIRETPQWELVRLTADLIGAGEARYRTFHDKAWSLTDCISMEAMLRNGLTDVATTDKHFKQAGFKLLLAVP